MLKLKNHYFPKTAEFIYLNFEYILEANASFKLQSLFLLLIHTQNFFKKCLESKNTTILSIGRMRLIVFTLCLYPYALYD